ncbi:hypothetical protein L218DRAFT_854539, partial [Marasmius fiardii PR-910]
PMPITEFAILKLNTPITSEGRLGMLLKRLQTSQSSWSSYPILLYSDYLSINTSKPSTSTSDSTVYLISGWESVEAHQKWIESDENQELLRLFGEEFGVEIRGFWHLSLDFEEFQWGLSEVLGVTKIQAENGNYLGQSVESEALWTGEGYDVENDSEGRALFRFAVYRDLPVGVGEKEVEKSQAEFGSEGGTKTVFMKRIPGFF